LVEIKPELEAEIDQPEMNQNYQPPKQRSMIKKSIRKEINDEPEEKLIYQVNMKLLKQKNQRQW